MKRKILIHCLLSIFVVQACLMPANASEVDEISVCEETVIIEELGFSNVEETLSETDDENSENDDDSSISVEVLGVNSSEETNEMTEKAEGTEYATGADVSTDLYDNVVENDEVVQKEIINSTRVSLNRENIIYGDFLGNMAFEIESGYDTENNVLFENVSATITNNYETMTIDEEVYDTAPVIQNSTSLKVDLSDETTNGMRFKAVVTPTQRAAAIEYGFLIATTEALENNNLELTFDITEITFISRVSYSIEDSVDKIFAIDENGNYVISMVMYNVPENAYVKNVTARPYIIYDIDGVETLVYGNTYSNSLYRTAKQSITSSSDEFEIAYAQSIIDTAEDSEVYLNSATEIYLEERFDGRIGITPDIDVIKIVPEESGFYTLDFMSDDAVTYEVLDEFGCDLSETVINYITNETAYLFEESQTYYVRVKGNPNTDYSIQATPCLQDAVIYDFADDTDGFNFGNGATGTVENGILNISINKSVSLTKAYMQKSNLSIDLFDYSRLIIRMKNTTNTTNLSGTVGIDLEYDGSSIDYTLDSSMSANMTGFENIEFDFTTRYGNVSSLKLSFGKILSSLSGNIYIDSIAILPMPEVLGWEFEETNENWSSNDRISSAAIEDGALVLNMLGSTSSLSPAIISPGTSAYDFDRYDVLKIRLKNETLSDNMQVYFSTLAAGHDSFNENKKFFVEISPSSTEYVEYTIDFTEHALFTDSLKSIMISIPAEGTASIDYIRLYKHTISYDDVIWSFDTDLEGFTSNNERHSLSVADGAMNIETQNADWGAFFTPDQLELPTSEYRYLVLGINSATADTQFQAYFKTSTMNGYAETDHQNKIMYKHTLQIEESSSFREYVIDLPYVFDGYTSGYTGDLEQFMLALPTVGNYKIDYIKLTNGNKNEELTVSATKNSEYKILVTKNNNHTIGTYTLNYDDSVFELVDACMFTYPFEINEGQIAGTDITITSVSDGTVTFTVSNKTAAGAINSLRFKALKNAESKITVSASIG